MTDIAPRPQAVQLSPDDEPIRLMIVDDSLVARTVMARIIGDRPEFEIVAAVPNAAQALDLVARVPVDIILLDVAMPGIDGLAALPDLLARSHGARVLMVSSGTGEGAAATIRALAQGAADTVLKPLAGELGGRFAEILVERLLRIGRAPRADMIAPPDHTPPVRAGESAPGAGPPITCLALGASTGGPHALARFFAALSPQMTAPILVTQHLPAPFIAYFARQLTMLAGRDARIAWHDAPLVPGAILIAPGDGHLRVVRRGGGLRIRIDRARSSSGHMPSVDPMLASLGDAAGAAGAAVVFSGMGRDGLIGAGLMAQRGGEIMVQDAATSVVWGMPGAIAKAGLASAILPPEGIAERIGARAKAGGGAAAWR